MRPAASHRRLGRVEIGGSAVVDLRGLDELIAALGSAGYRTLGPVVRNDTIVHGSLTGVDALPSGFHDHQSPGHYDLVHCDDGELFGWAVGPASFKSELFPPHQIVWKASTAPDGFSVEEPSEEARPVAMVGARPCELAGLEVLDRVLGTRGADPVYSRRREAAFVAVVECGAPAADCFCTSMGTGPEASGAFDLALTELYDPPDRLDPDNPMPAAGHRFLVNVGSELGSELLDKISHHAAGEQDLARRQAILATARKRVGRFLDTEGLASILERNIESRRFEEVAERCLACGNCTMVCPTCFCSDIRDASDLDGGARHERTWSSCFDLEHSYLHGGAIRRSVSSRYRQWLTHKLSTWWEQFGTSGCVGCGRCITWCPVGIDLTAEAAAIRASDGASHGRTPQAFVRGAALATSTIGAQATSSGNDPDTPPISEVPR